MTSRRPLVAVSGDLREMPSGDVVDPTALPPENVFIQQTDPALATPYIWYQVDGTGALVTIWVSA